VEKNRERDEFLTFLREVERSEAGEFNTDEQVA